MNLDALKHQWQLLRQDAPGERFAQLYARSHRGGQLGLGGIALMLAAVLVLLLGLALMVLPGPGLPVFVLGLALLAGQSLTAAKAMDAGELKIRSLIQRLRR